ncbi:MFS general substrate transporter [Periconia macrospinosa]|uniref:MFS general substrate transporter n=1 Tax=Periconia macrospinosa TaxID=97972 RepID=A0A2V1D0R9_9PLEO|nr:MFS general substrate transporter [Periconia macrospinosa]
MGDSISADPPAVQNGDKTISNNRGWRFWAIFPALCVTALLSALEATVVSNAASTITTELNLGDNYPWIVNAFLMTSTAVQPVYGQLADLFGRRWITISAVALLVFGSGIAGGASTGGMLIAGRAIQGIGGGGINMLIDLIICDLVPLRERPKYLGLVAVIFAIGTSLGPFIGGALVQQASWRWVFYINLPIGGVAMVLLYLFLHTNFKPTTFKQSLGRFDLIGSLLVLGSSVAIVFALTYGGSRFAWSSWHIIVPLVIGLVTLILFHAYEASPWVKEPLLPPHLFGNRTSAISFYATFIQSLMFVWVIYFLPVYFQAVLGSSPNRAGVQLLPTVIGIVPFAGIGAAFIEKVGKYRPIHLVGMALMAIGTGTFALLNEKSSTGVWVGLQILQVAGFAVITPALLPAVQAPLSDKDNASSTAAWAYIRSYGAIWGITVPVAIFNNQFEQRLYKISDPVVRSTVSGGNAYAHGTKEFMSTLPSQVRSETVTVFVESLRIVWIVAAAICGASTLLIPLEKEIPMRTELETEYGYKNGQEQKKGRHSAERV